MHGFASKQRGFSAGIDDYLVKPVDLDELLLRISAILRRAHIAQSKKLTVGSLTLDADAVSAKNIEMDAEIAGGKICVRLEQLEQEEKICGGEISVESERGKGSCFYFRF